MKRSLLLSLFTGALLLFITACDFNAASDAVDEFDLVVELPPIATVVNVQAINATSSNPLSREVHTTFEGPDAAEVIDIYSDPISSLTFDDGFASFGLDSTRHPTTDNPARLTLRVQAEGYVSTSVPLLITREGTLTRPIRLAPENPQQSPNGTAGQRKQSNVQNDGSASEDVTVETGSTSNDEHSAQASARIPSGTKLRTADGDPLQGRITTDLSVYDNSADAQNLLPSEAVTSDDGSRRLLQGAVRFQVKDDDGRVAGQFENSDDNTTSLTANLPSLRTQDGTPVLVLVNPETGQTREIQANASSTTSVSRKSHGGWHIAFSGNTVTATSPSGLVFGPITLNQAGRFFASMGVTLPNTCTPTGELSIARNGHRGSLGLTISGDGFSAEATLSDASDPAVVSAADLFEGAIPAIGPVTVTVTAPDDQTVETTMDWCSDTQSVSLPEPAADRIDATVVLAPNCPAGEDIPVSGDIDGYTVNYRLAGSTNTYRSASDIRVSTSGTPEKFDRAEVDITGVLPSRDYEFVGTLGSEGSTSQIITMPQSNGASVQISDAELNDLCE